MIPAGEEVLQTRGHQSGGGARQKEAGETNVAARRSICSSWLFLSDEGAHYVGEAGSTRLYHCSKSIPERLSRCGRVVSRPLKRTRGQLCARRLSPRRLSDTPVLWRVGGISASICLFCVGIQEVNVTNVVELPSVCFRVSCHWRAAGRV